MRTLKTIFMGLVYVMVVFLIMGTIKNYICVPFIK